MNVVQEDVSSVSKSKSEPSPRVSGHVTQNGVYKGLSPTLLDSGSMAEVMPSILAASMDLDTQPVSPDKYNLKSASGSSIILSAETSFDFALSSDCSLVLSVLISDSLANQELILSWRSIVAPSSVVRAGLTKGTKGNIGIIPVCNLINRSSKLSNGHFINNFFCS